MIFKLFIVILFNLSFLFSHGEDHSHDNHQHKERKYKPSGIIRGSVIDNMLEEGKAYANISIVKEDSDDIIAGGITDENGLFLIDKIPFGKYFLVVQYIGYEDMIIDGIVIRPPDKMELDIGQIRINAKTIMLEGVSVVDKLAPIIEDIAKTTYPVAETARAEGGSADEVLEKLPSITVDADGNISLRGNSNVTILIDGRKSQLSVDMINANMIEKVEVMTTPSAKFDPDGMAGIINIVLSKNEFVGRSGNLNLNLSEWNGKNLSGTFNSFKDNWNIFSSYSTSQRQKQGRGERNTIYYDLDDNVTSSTSSKEYSEKYPEKNNLKVGIEHYPNDIGLLAFDLTYIQSKGLDTNTVIIDQDLENPFITIEDEESTALNYGLGYFIDDRENKKNFSIQFDYDDHNGSEIRTGYTDEVIQDEGINKIFRIDYTAPIENEFNEDAKYEIGFKQDSEDDKHYSVIEGEDFNWDYDNSISAAYVNVLYNFTEKFGMQVGARFEDQEKQSIIDFNQQDCSILDQSTCETSGFCSWDNGVCAETLFGNLLNNLGNDLDVTYNHTRAYPSLYFLYDTQGKGNFKFEFGRRIERPSHWSLNPIPDLEEAEAGFIRQGNPYLIPENIYKSEISYSNRIPIGFLKASLYYSRVTDKLDRDKDTYCYGSTCNDPNDSSDETNYMVLSWDNVSKSVDRGIDFTFMTRPLPNWDLMINGNYWNNILDGIEADQQGNEYGFWGMMNSTIRLKNSQQIGIYSHFSSPMTISSGEIKGMQRFDLSYKKKANKRFNYTIKIKDLFDTGGFNIITDQLIDLDGDDIFDSREFLKSEYRRGKRNLSITFEYRFGDFQKKKYKREEQRGYNQGGGMDVGF
ncbi:MAG: hypothetical protein CMG14_03530 [Candidatus Marinimicrobia bacterium]|nr:hypothetical protein [Candidatus Neomarinimicrobiota bacterium]|tara:strand:+ start:1153 stop:3726 length:2574 start_codon:yes stop_codon:yes gene_type:complete